MHLKDGLLRALALPCILPLLLANILSPILCNRYDSDGGRKRKYSRSRSPAYDREPKRSRPMGRFPNVIYCGGIPRDIREKDIEDAFAKYVANRPAR